MAEQPVSTTTTLSGIRWREAFPFTHLFRAFRIAIQPSKIALGLIALLLLYCGGMALDWCCPMHDRAVPNEALAYEAFFQHARSGDRFTDERNVMRREVEAGYAEKLVQYHVVATRDAADAAARDGDDLAELKAAIERKRDSDLQQAGATLDLQLEQALRLSGESRHNATVAAHADHDRSVRSIYDNAADEYAAARQIKGEGLFVHFFVYELNQISNVVTGVGNGNFFGQGNASDALLSPATMRLPADAQMDSAAIAAAGANESVALVGTPAANRPGVIPSLVRFFTVGPVWLLTQHPIYFVLMGAYFLALWAVFGGAISRIAAVHVARDEKLSIRSAMRFSVGKFLSFLFAPIIPLLIVVVLGLLITAASLIVGNIPWIGPILVGALFGLALIAGFMMALVLLGLVGGFNLMYPTIAVEGSDSFDAISRSFSYLYARPWRLGFYSAVAIIYGALTYQFVRLFIYLMLLLTHKFVGMGILVHANNMAPLWTTMWPSPATAARLSYDVDYMALMLPQATGATLIGFWVYLAIAILGAFAISFYFSANTIIYYLMRREVDATEMDDVYLEQVEDEFADAAAFESTPAPAESAAAIVAAEVGVSSTRSSPPADAPAGGEA